MKPEEYKRRFKIAHDLVGIDPQILGGPSNPNQLVIRCEKVTHTNGVGKRTGKYIHLGMTAADAMRLLMMLSAAQKKLGLPIPDEISSYDFVPPDDEKN